jgi:hypothetical protein
MRIHRSRRIDRHVAEQLLDGRPLDAKAGHDALLDLLAAAAAAPADGEQKGEGAALAAFRETCLSPVQSFRRRPLTPVAPTRYRSAKVLAAALAVTVLGGVAVAAGTGHLPGTGGGRPAANPRSTDPGARAAMTAPTGTTAAPASGGVGTAAGPAPAAGPCRTYTASAATDRAELLRDPAFTGLIRAAGGKDEVARYCTAVLESEDHGARGTAAPGSAAGARRTHGSAAGPTPGDAGARGASHSPKGTSSSAEQENRTPTDHPSPNGAR